MTVDRAAMNKKLFAALKPGGFLIIADHSAKAGAGTSVGKTLHRIEESALRERGRGGGLQACRGRATSSAIRRTPRDEKIFRPKIAGRRVRAEIPEAELK